ncbi:hypothetical protein CO670_17490 [Rhizobium sp. J15]|nr:hypothetical protein CO670_17490 [Rhizobium sp. J15]
MLDGEALPLLPHSCARHRNSFPFNRVIHGADAPWLDSCDGHRNEGGEVGATRPAHLSMRRGGYSERP